MARESTGNARPTPGAFRDGHASASAIADVVEWGHIQELSDALYVATGIPSAIIDLDGIVLSGSGWQPICTEFHRQHPVSRQRCIESDTKLFEHTSTIGEFAIYCCPHGLVDCAAPLVVDGEHIGNVFTGQFLFESPDLERFRAQAAEFGFDEDAYLRALAQVPIFEERQVRAYIAFLTRLAGLVSGMVLANLRQEEALCAQQKIEAQLRASEARYRRIIETAAEGIAVIDAERRLSYVNEDYCRLLGYEVEELTGAPLDDVLFPEDRAAQLERWAHRQAGKAGRHETRLRHKDGSARWALVSARPVFDESGTFDGVLSMITDIHDRKLAEERKRRSQARLSKTVDAAVMTLTRTIESRDPYTAGHQERVAELAVAIGRKLALRSRSITSLRIASLIHDLGKIAVPAEILAKPGALTEMEHNLIRQHPESGFEILRDMRFPGPVASIVRDHHERLDGSGYPRGLTGDEIRIESRILGVADVVEAMSSHRPYRPALGIDAALEEISAQRAVKYDAGAVDACVALFREEGFAFSTTS